MHVNLIRLFHNVYLFYLRLGQIRNIVDSLTCILDMFCMEWFNPDSQKNPLAKFYCLHILFLLSLCSRVFLKYTTKHSCSGWRNVQFFMFCASMDPTVDLAHTSCARQKAW